MEKSILDKSSRAVLKSQRFDTSQSSLKTRSSSEWLGRGVEEGGWGRDKERGCGEGDELRETRLFRFYVLM